MWLESVLLLFNAKSNLKLKTFLFPRWYLDSMQSDGHVKTYFWTFGKEGTWWPILGICMGLHLTHPSTVSSEQTHTHTHREHIHRAVGSHLCCGARGCSRAPQSWYWRRRERCTFTPPAYNPCRTWDSNPQHSGHKSDSLTIRQCLTV